MNAETLSSSGQTVMALMMLAVFILGGGGLWLLIRRREWLRGGLMLVCALVMLADVLLWAL